MSTWSRGVQLVARSSSFVSVRQFRVVA
jgi:hypothetical protein